MFCTLDRSLPLHIDIVTDILRQLLAGCGDDQGPHLGTCLQRLADFCREQAQLKRGLCYGPAVLPDKLYLDCMASVACMGSAASLDQAESCSGCHQMAKCGAVRRLGAVEVGEAPQSLCMLCCHEQLIEIAWHNLYLHMLASSVQLGMFRTTCLQSSQVPPAQHSNRLPCCMPDFQAITAALLLWNLARALFQTCALGEQHVQELKAEHSKSTAAASFWRTHTVKTAWTAWRHSAVIKQVHRARLAAGLTRWRRRQLRGGWRSWREHVALGRAMQQVNEHVHPGKETVRSPASLPDYNCACWHSSCTCKLLSLAATLTAGSASCFHCRMPKGMEGMAAAGSFEESQQSGPAEDAAQTCGQNVEGLGYGHAGL